MGELEVSSNISCDFLPCGGRTKYYLHNWEKITQSKYVINIIKGCKLFFNNAPILQSFKNQFICKMLTDLENDKVITKTVHDIEGVTHSIFLVEKRSSQTHDKKFRLILNMKDLNKQNITK